MRGTYSAGLILLCGLAAVTTASAGNIVLNGGFETGDFSSWTPGGNVDGLSGVSNAFPDFGMYAADLGAQITDFTLDQTVAVDPSAVYNVTFFLAQGFDPDPAHGITNSFTASFDGDILLSETNAPTSAYEMFSYQVTTGSSDTSAVIHFGAYNDADFFHLDGVSVTEETGITPEPGSVFLATAGLAACLAFVRRRRLRD